MNNRMRRMIKQKLIGLSLIAIGILCPIVFEGDATASLLVVPMGLMVLFTREDILY